MPPDAGIGAVPAAAGAGLRLLLAYEFRESGVEKYRGENRFADIMDRFPFRFDVLPADIS